LLSGQDLAQEQARCKTFEISPTGPIFGSHTKPTSEQAAMIEDAILNSEVADILQNPSILKRENIKGARRPLRIRPENAEISSGTDALGEYLELVFELPAGSYATVFLREFLKHNVS